MKIDVHLQDTGRSMSLVAVLLDKLLRKVDRFMATEAETLAVLKSADDKLTVMAADIQALKDKAAAVPQTVADAAAALATRIDTIEASAK